MPPLGPFFDNAIWVALGCGLVFCLLRYGATSADGRLDLRSSGRAALLSLADVVGSRRSVPRSRTADTGDGLSGEDALERWCADEVHRVEDERRRLDERRVELADLLDRLRAQKSAPVAKPDLP